MKRTLIIAEAGVNHNGDIERAKKLIDAAAEAGVDYVKFQTFKADTIVSKTAKKADYQIVNTKSKDDSQYEMLKALELSDENHFELIQYCASKNIKFFSTAFDTEGLDFLNSIGFDFFKIPSGEITNYGYLKKLANYKKPLFLSTGMATMEEIGDALELLLSEGLSKEDITVLHCNTEYPTPMSDVNLLAMLDIQKTYHVNIGYSDHTLGIEVPAAAVALGATVIEKHFTLDRNLPGPDHAASLEPKELKALVLAIRNIEQACGGNGKKEPSKSESKNRTIARKSIHLKSNVSKGDIITEEMFIALRPGDGISPMQIPNVLGKRFTKDIDSYSKLTISDFE